MIFAASAIEHVLDSLDWHLLESLHWEIHLPGSRDAFHGDGFGLTKYAVLMILAAILICVIYVPLARKISTGEAPTGAFWNLFESILTFIRDEVAKPYIGKEADKYVWYLWTVFLFVLTCNLLGMFPFLGSPTASFSMTLVLATGTLLLITIGTILRHGPAAFVFSFAPHMEMPLALKIPMILMLWPIEVMGLFIKCFVLAVRLFANMFAGHMVLATILLFIPAVRNTNPALEWGVTIASVLGVLALSLLELFVAFLQAFLFTFLTALFLGGVLEHAEHAVGGHHDHSHGHDHCPGTIPEGDAGAEDVHLKTEGQH